MTNVARPLGVVMFAVIPFTCCSAYVHCNSTVQVFFEIACGIQECQRLPARFVFKLVPSAVAVLQGEQRFPGGRALCVCPEPAGPGGEAESKLPWVVPATAGGSRGREAGGGTAGRQAEADVSCSRVACVPVFVVVWVLVGGYWAVSDCSQTGFLVACHMSISAKTSGLLFCTHKIQRVTTVFSSAAKPQPCSKRLLEPSEQVDER